MVCVGNQQAAHHVMTLSPKKEDGIQIYMPNCHNKVLFACIITKSLENTQLACGSNAFSYSLIT